MYLTNDILAESAWARVVLDSLGFVGLFLNFTFVIMRGPNKLLKLKKAHSTIMIPLMYNLVLWNKFLKKHT